jgi:heptosyltransferase-2
LRAKPDAKKILVIRYRFIGDTILTVPFLRNLRDAYPEAQIDVLVGPQSGEVLQGCPYINDLIYFDTTRFHKYDRGQGEKKSFWSYVFLLRNRKYDTVFILKRSWSSALLALFSGARARIGYATEGRQIILTDSVPFNPDMHEVDSTLTVLECAGIPAVNRYLESWTTAEEQTDARQALEASCPVQDQDLKASLSDRQFVLIHAAAAHPDKLYPLSSWARVIQDLHTDGYIPVFTGSAEDRHLYEELQQLAGVRGCNLAGKLSIRQSIAVYELMELAICTDSGPAHLASAVGIPTLSIFGPTDPVRWRPYSALPRMTPRTKVRVGSSSGLESTERTVEHEERRMAKENAVVYDESLSCRPCNYNKTCRNRECLTELSPKLVVERARQLLHSWNGARI